MNTNLKLDLNKLEQGVNDIHIAWFVKSIQDLMLEYEEDLESVTRMLKEKPDNIYHQAEQSTIKYMLLYLEILFGNYLKEYRK